MRQTVREEMPGSFPLPSHAVRKNDRLEWHQSVEAHDPTVIVADTVRPHAHRRNTYRQRKFAAQVIKAIRKAGMGNWRPGWSGEHTDGDSIVSFHPSGSDTSEFWRERNGYHRRKGIRQIGFR